MERLETIAEHLARCEKCESSLQALQAEDTILNHLRHHAEEALAVDEAACRAMAERAHIIPQAETAPPTVSDDQDGKRVEGLPLPAVFGAYLLLEQLGQGGMGIVFKARQESLKRFVAVKMVRAGIYASTEERLRFQREGEVIARIHHPHVVQIHEFGEHQGQLYFSMELLEGGTLASKLNGCPLREREAAELVRTLARTVQAAHEHGIVHRDLKPGNVLFAADGTVKISDFGLAKVLDNPNSDTCSDAILGTPSYMAPEQARGESGKIGPAADVYALGAILYETLTGQPPFRTQSRYATLELVRTCEPKPPSYLRPGLVRDLEAICLKCLEKEPNRRYLTAAALADDLERALEGRSTCARPLRWYNRTYRVVCRHPAIAVTICGLVLLASFLSILTYFRDPQRKVEDLQRRLRRGETVTLIGETGDPVWSRWDYQSGATGGSRSQDGTFSIHALGVGTLTLLPNPQRNYRFRAEVRHDEGVHLSHVGLCFAQSRHAASTGWQHFFCSLTFDDLEALIPEPQTGQMVSRVQFIVWHASPSGSLSNMTETVAHFTPTLPPLARQHLWRPLAVEVRAEGIHLFWESQHLHVPHQRILEMARTARSTWVGNRMVDPFPELQPAFAPQDALGLFVQDGQASFRHVRVEPLPQP